MTKLIVVLSIAFMLLVAGGFVIYRSFGKLTTVVPTVKSAVPVPPPFPSDGLASVSRVGTNHEKLVGIAGGFVATNRRTYFPNVRDVRAVSGGTVYFKDGHVKEFLWD